MGTPEFAIASLDILVKNKYEIAGVVTAPDKPAGRGRKLNQSAVKLYAVENNLPVLQPDNLKNPDFIKQLRALRADLQIVVAFRMLPEMVWNMPSLGTYNLHASLLPKYRGAAPINWAIINGEKETGVTTFKLKHEIDTGNILFFEKVIIAADETAGQLHDELMNKGASLVLKTVKELETTFLKGDEPGFLMQDNILASHAPKLNRDVCKINWNESVEKIYNLIRGLSPYPGAYTEMPVPGGEKLVLKIFKADFKKCEHMHTNGYLSTDNKSYINVYCKEGFIEIKELQLEGKKRMLPDEFLRGFRITINNLDNGTCL